MSAAARGRPQLCISSANQSPAALGASLISQGVPSSKTVHRTVLEEGIVEYGGSEGKARTAACLKQNPKSFWKIDFRAGAGVPPVSRSRCML